MDPCVQGSKAERAVADIMGGKVPCTGSLLVCHPVGSQQLAHLLLGNVGDDERHALVLQSCCQRPKCPGSGCIQPIHRPAGLLVDGHFSMQGVGRLIQEQLTAMCMRQSPTARKMLTAVSCCLVCKIQTGTGYNASRGGMCTVRKPVAACSAPVMQVGQI